MDSPLLGASSLDGSLNKKQRTADIDDTDYSVSELLVELEWNIADSKRSLRNEDPAHAPSLCRALHILMREGHMCDLTLLVENGGLIPVHSCIMAAVSPVLSARLIKATPPIQVLQLNTLPGLSDLQKRALCNEETVRNLLGNFAYSGVLDLPKDAPLELVFEDSPLSALGQDVDRAIKLLAASMALQISGAVMLVVDFLKTLIDTASCLTIYIASSELGCTEVQNAAQTFIDQNFSKVALEQAWVDAPEVIIRRILSRSELCARDELEVFRAMSRWCLEDIEHRNASFQAMVADSLITRLYLVQEDILETLLSSHELVLSNEPAQRMIARELERRRMGIRSDAAHLTRRFVPAIQFREKNASASVTNGPIAPLSPSHAGRVRSGSMVLKTDPQSRPDNFVSNVTILSGHEKAVCALAANDCWLASGSSDSSIRIWDLRTRKGGVMLRGHTDSISSLRFFNSDRLVSGSFDKSIRIWSVPSWKFHGLIAEVAHEDPVTCLTVISRAEQLASGSAGGEIKIWSCYTLMDQEEWRPVYMLQNAHAHVLWSCCEWGSWIVSGSSDKEIRVWDSSDWSLRARFTNHKDEVQALVVIGDELYSGSDDGVIAVHAPTSDQNSGPVRYVELYRPVMALAEYNGLLAVGFGDGGIILLNPSDLSKFGELKGHAASVMSLVTRNELLISGSFDKTVRVWEYHEKSAISM